MQSQRFLQIQLPFFFLLETQAAITRVPLYFAAVKPGILTSGIGMTEQPGAPERAVGAHKKHKQQLSAAFQMDVQELESRMTLESQAIRVGFGFSSIS